LQALDASLAASEGGAEARRILDAYAAEHGEDDAGGEAEDIDADDM
jgi:hypothetical protein